MGIHFESPLLPCVSAWSAAFSSRHTRSRAQLVFIGHALPTLSLTLPFSQECPLLPLLLPLYPCRTPDNFEQGHVPGAVNIPVMKPGPDGELPACRAEGKAVQSPPSLFASLSFFRLTNSNNVLGKKAPAVLACCKIEATGVPRTCRYQQRHLEKQVVSFFSGKVKRKPISFVGTVHPSYETPERAM